LDEGLKTEIAGIFGGKVKDEKNEDVVGTKKKERKKKGGGSGGTRKCRAFGTSSSKRGGKNVEPYRLREKCLDKEKRRMGAAGQRSS